MNLIGILFEALHNSRNQEADRIIRKYQHLVEEAHAHERRREIETAGKNARRALELTFVTGESK